MSASQDTICTKTRYLTTHASSTNTAHQIWYNKLTPIQRFELGQKVEKLADKQLPIKDKLNACLNYIEDNLNEFK